MLELLYIFLYSLRALGTMSHSLKQQTLNLNSSITAMLKYLNNKLPAFQAKRYLCWKYEQSLNLNFQGFAPILKLFLLVLLLLWTRPRFLCASRTQGAFRDVFRTRQNTAVSRRTHGCPVALSIMSAVGFCGNWIIITCDKKLFAVHTKEARFDFKSLSLAPC